MRGRDEVGPDPLTEDVIAAERLVLAVRSSRSAEIGGEDSSIGDLVRVLVGDDEGDALALLAMELEILGAAIADPHTARELPMRAFLGAMARRAAASVELHRRLRLARGSR